MAHGKGIETGTRVQVLLGERMVGTVAYVGNTLFSSGKWIGVVLDNAVGQNNGTVQGEKYFTCEDNHGIFVRQSKVKEQSAVHPIWSEGIGTPSSLVLRYFALITSLVAITFILLQIIMAVFTYTLVSPPVTREPLWNATWKAICHHSQEDPLWDRLWQYITGPQEPQSFWEGTICPLFRPRENTSTFYTYFY